MRALDQRLHSQTAKATRTRDRTGPRPSLTVGEPNRSDAVRGGIEIAVDVPVPLPGGLAGWPGAEPS